MQATNKKTLANNPKRYLPGATIRSRHTTGVLSEMGLDALIAKDTDACASIPRFTWLDLPRWSGPCSSNSMPPRTAALETFGRCAPCRTCSLPCFDETAVQTYGADSCANPSNISLHFSSSVSAITSCGVARSKRAIMARPLLVRSGGPSSRQTTASSRS